MSLPRLLIPFALSVVLLACGRESASPEPVAVAQIAPAPSTQLPAAQAQVTQAQSTTRTRASEVPGLEIGQDYDIIEGGQRFSRGEDVEVAEVFAYWCGGCAHFDPLVSGWKQRLPAGTVFVYVPMVGNPQDKYPQAFYAADLSGLVGKVHSAIFGAIHVDRSLRPNASADEIAAFIAKNGGGSAQDIKSTMESFAVNANLGRARQFAIRNGVSHTPMLIINGQYRVNGKSQEDQLRIADTIIRHLIGKAPPALAD